jgi:hypothetical protein
MNLMTCCHVANGTGSMVSAQIKKNEVRRRTKRRGPRKCEHAERERKKERRGGNALERSINVFLTWPFTKRSTCLFRWRDS